jgi:large subunit ribosomal protein L35
MASGTAMRHNLEHKSSRKRRALSRDQHISADQNKRMKKLLGL